MSRGARQSRSFQLVQFGQCMSESEETRVPVFLDPAVVLPGLLVPPLERQVESQIKAGYGHLVVVAGCGKHGCLIQFTPEIADHRIRPGRGVAPGRRVVEQPLR